VVFSLFGRRDKSDLRKGKGVFQPKIPDSTLRGPAIAPSVEQQRETARKTAEKIDRIESEMITVPVGGTTVRPSTPPAPAADRAAPIAAHPGPRPQGGQGLEGRAAQTAMAPLDFSTSIVLGDSAGAGGIHINASSLPADLEEAAILFANGQAAAAVATLRAALTRGDLGENARLAWLMLFDVLQAGGQRTEFEAHAMDFAARFETSPPPWIEPQAEPAAPKRVAAAVVVAFGPRLDASAQRQLEQVQKAGLQKRSVVADFSRVVASDHVGASLIAKLIDTFVRANRELSVLGIAQLFDVARATIEPGRRDENTGGWQLALAALRLQGEKQAFEDLSIDYCVTYEVSPPSWEDVPPKITLVGKEAVAAAAPAEAKPAEPAPRGSAIDGQALVLRGQVSGRMVTELGLLRAYAADRADIVIDARALQRLDFAAAGELLNEVVVLRGAAKTVLIVEPSFIVEALLVVMGIHELAEIRRRKL
jgi:anti-anti-sigma regulatory factor